MHYKYTLSTVGKASTHNLKPTFPSGQKANRELMSSENKTKQNTTCALSCHLSGANQMQANISAKLSLQQEHVTM